MKQTLFVNVIIIITLSWMECKYEFINKIIMFFIIKLCSNDDDDDKIFYCYDGLNVVHWMMGENNGVVFIN